MKLISDEEIKNVIDSVTGFASDVCLACPTPDGNCEDCIRKLLLQAQLASCEQQAKAEFEKWRVAQIKAEQYIKTESVKSELRQVKAEIESTPFQFFKPCWDKSEHCFDGNLEIRQDAWDSFWKGKGIE